MLRVDARALVPRLRAELAALLTGLTAGDWALSTACPGWSVHDVAAHLLGVELGNVSVRRDRWRLGPAAGDDLDAWLDVAREYMERYVHQQQIRDAAGARRSGRPSPARSWRPRRTRCPARSTR